MANAIKRSKDEDTHWQKELCVDNKPSMQQNSLSFLTADRIENSVEVRSLTCKIQASAILQDVSLRVMKEGSIQLD